MPEDANVVVRVEKRKIKRKKHSHKHSKNKSKKRSEGYSSSVHAGRFRRFDSVERSAMLALVKIIALLGIAGIVLWIVSQFL